MNPRWEEVAAAGVKLHVRWGILLFARKKTLGENVKSTFDKCEEYF